MLFEFDGLNLNDGVTYKVTHLARPFNVAARPSVVTERGVRGGAAVTLMAPGARRITIEGHILAANANAWQDARDALLRVLARPNRRLVATLDDVTRFGRATLQSFTCSVYQGERGGTYQAEFVADDAYESAATPAADVRTPTLALLPDGSPAYGSRFSLTPGGSAPALPRMLAVNQAGGVTPIAWRVTNLSTGVAIATSASVPAGSLLRLDRRGAAVSSMAGVLGYWPFCDAASPFRDFSGSGRDLAVSGNTLDTNLVAFWKLDEASGATRNDSIGANHLTDNNTVVQAAGKIGNGAQTVNATGNFLSRADNADLSTGDIDFTIAGWVRLSADAGGGGVGVVTKWTTPGSGGGTDDEYAIIAIGAGASQTLRFDVRNTANGANGTISSTTKNLTAAWTFFVAWHDATANTINIQIDNGSVQSAAHTTGVRDGTATFRIAAWGAGSVVSGITDAVGLWKRTLTAQERTDLYNAGAGQEHPFAGGGGTAVTFLQDGPDAPPDGQACDAAAGFDGTASGYADSSVAALGATGSLTLMGWVYLTSVSGTRVFASKASANNGYSAGLAGGVFRGQAGNGATTRTLDGYTTAEASRWYFVALSVTSTAVKLYAGTLDLPPVLEDSDTGLVLTAGANNFRAGAGHQVSDGTAYPTAGRLSEWMVVNAELSRSQIETAWRDGLPAWNEVGADFEGDVPALDPTAATTNTIELYAAHTTTAPTPRIAMIFRSRWE